MAIAISIHALREEGDENRGKQYPMYLIFLSTPSVRRATGLRFGYYGDSDISIHALREEGDVKEKDYGKITIEFLSTPSVRRATRSPADACHTMGNFYPRPP